MVDIVGDELVKVRNDSFAMHFFGDCRHVPPRSKILSKGVECRAQARNCLPAVHISQVPKIKYGLTFSAIDHIVKNEQHAPEIMFGAYLVFANGRQKCSCVLRAIWTRQCATHSFYLLEEWPPNDRIRFFIEILCQCMKKPPSWRTPLFNWRHAPLFAFVCSKKTKCLFYLCYVLYFRILKHYTRYISSEATIKCSTFRRIALAKVVCNLGVGKFARD